MEIETSTSINTLLEDGIIRIRVKKGAYLEVDHLAENLRAYRALIPEGRMLFLVVTTRDSGVSKEARELLAMPERQAHKKAEAFIVRTLPQRMLINFHIRMNQRAYPVKAFRTEAEGVAWLRTFKRESDGE